MSTVSVHSQLCYSPLITKVMRNVNGLHRYETLPLLTFILRDSQGWAVWHGLKSGPAGWLPGLGACLKHDTAQYLPAGHELGLIYGPDRRPVKITLLYKCCFFILYKSESICCMAWKSPEIVKNLCYLKCDKINVTIVFFCEQWCMVY